MPSFTWNWRLVKYDHLEPVCGEYYHAIHEVHYDENGKITMFTEEAMDVGGDGVEATKAYYDLLGKAFDAPVLLWSELMF